MENSFRTSGYVAFVDKRTFSSSSLCRFSLGLTRVKKGTNEKTTAFQPIEAWVKNEDRDKLNTIEMGKELIVEGFFKPDVWKDVEGIDHQRLVMVANKFYLREDKEIEIR